MSGRAVVFDLFHTLVDPEPLYPAGFDKRREIAAIAGVDAAGLTAFWMETYVERETTTIDLVDLFDRHCTAIGRPISAAGRAAIDETLGVAVDQAMPRTAPGHRRAPRRSPGARPDRCSTRLDRTLTRAWSDRTASHLTVGRRARRRSCRPCDRWGTRPERDRGHREHDSAVTADPDEVTRAAALLGERLDAGPLLRLVHQLTGERVDHFPTVAASFVIDGVSVADRRGTPQARRSHRVWPLAVSMPNRLPSTTSCVRPAPDSR